jgi:hypothetical protein
MKALIGGAVICTLAAGAQGASAPDSWVAMASRPDAHWVSGDSDASFAARAIASGLTSDADRSIASELERDDGAVFGDDDGGGKGTGGLGDDLGGCGISPAPEPSTWLLLAVGAMAFGTLRIRKKSRKS